jgi:hypothetical protein
MRPYKYRFSVNFGDACSTYLTLAYLADPCSHSLLDGVHVRLHSLIVGVQLQAHGLKVMSNGCRCKNQI